MYKEYFFLYCLQNSIFFMDVQKLVVKKCMATNEWRKIQSPKMMSFRNNSLYFDNRRISALQKFQKNKITLYFNLNAF